MPTREDVIEALRVVEDPEFGMDIVELGLLYDVAVEGSSVHVTYSLTSMGCPVGPMIEQQITETVAEMPGVEGVESELTWKDALAEHEAILQALEARDPQAASAAVCRHLIASHARWIGDGAEIPARGALTL